MGKVSRSENFLPPFRPMAPGGRASKKRAAPLQIGPKAKKVHLEKPHKKDEKSPAVKRSKPVTLPQTNDSDVDSDGGEGSSEEDVEIANEDSEMTDVPTKDPNGVYQI